MSQSNTNFLQHLHDLIARKESENKKMIPVESDQNKKIIARNEVAIKAFKRYASNAREVKSA